MGRLVQVCYRFKGSLAWLIVVLGVKRRGVLVVVS